MRSEEEYQALKRDCDQLERACLILMDAHQKLLEALEAYGLIHLTSDNDETVH